MKHITPLQSVKITLLTLMAMLLGACGSGGSEGTSGASSSGGPVIIGTGIFIDGPVQGIRYSSLSTQGTTNSRGEFQFVAGEQMAFSIGDLVLGTATAADVITPESFISPSSHEDALINMLRWLQSLDTDQNHQNGIQLPATSFINVTINFNQSLQSFENDGNVTTALFDSVGRSELISAQVAQDNFTQSLASFGLEKTVLSLPGRTMKSIIWNSHCPEAANTLGYTLTFSGSAETVTYQGSDTITSANCQVAASETAQLPLTDPRAFYCGDSDPSICTLSELNTLRQVTNEEDQREEVIHISYRLGSNYIVDHKKVTAPYQEDWVSVTFIDGSKDMAVMDSVLCDLGLETRNCGPIVDSDLDGIGNETDNCIYTPNTDNKNGVGDACDTKVANDWLNGTWAGTGAQTDNSSWSIKAQLNGNSQTYLIEYPSLVCSGNWTLTSINSQQAHFQEVLTQNSGLCSPSGKIVISYRNQDELHYRWDDDSSSMAAEAILTRSAKIVDDDGDGIGNTNDNCPTTPNADQLDTDNNGIGDACDTVATKDWLNGVWTGTGFQSNNTSWSIQAELSGNSQTYLIEYPSLVCSGNWTFTAINSQQALFQEVLTQNSGLCSPSGKIVISYRNQDELHYRWEDDSSSMTAEAILTRSVALVDDDGDGIANTVDNCPTLPNADQLDIDNDDIGDACDTLIDTDGDGIANGKDNCPTLANSDQIDIDTDGVGDLCDDYVDGDSDGIEDTADNCPLVANPEQEDQDTDGTGDVCDDLLDKDNDSIADNKDNCISIDNVDQTDTDNDGMGDACDVDDDNDGTLDPFDDYPTNDGYKRIRTIGSIDAGDVHTCAIINEGQVACWGSNAEGQLGVDGVNKSSELVTVPDISTAVAVGVGDTHSCALLASGQVTCWGSNKKRQLGDGTAVSSVIPVAVLNITNATALSVGKNHSCAIEESGSVLCWGDNSKRQLGNGSEDTEVAEPVVVSNMSDAISVGAGKNHSCAVRSSGQVNCWGSGDLGDEANVISSSVPVVVQDIIDAVQVSTGESYSCAVHLSGQISCWGWGSNGRLGNGASSSSNKPVLVSGIDNAAAVATGEYSCALLTDGNVRCWGENDLGQLGSSSIEESNIPLNVPVLSVASIATGYNHSCVTHDAGGVSCWGNNGDRSRPDNVNSLTGKLGDKTVLDAKVSTPKANELAYASAVTLGSDFACALKGDGVSCWGSGQGKRLGRESFYTNSLPADIDGLSDITKVSSGADHSCALTNDGSVKCWGMATQGQLGIGFSSGYYLPTDVKRINDATDIIFAGLKAIDVSAGYQHSCAVLENGQVACWGDNGYGRLGNGSETDSSVPELVSSLSNAKQVSAGRRHSCAVQVDGTVYCWGENFQGQLGNGTKTSSTSPVLVSAVANATQVSAGYDSTCALLSTGEVKCWGGRASMLGNGSSVGSSVPVTVSGISDAIAISGHLGHHACAVLASGSVMCWGRNNNGQLGDASTNESNIPVSALNISTELSQAKAITTNQYNTCALLNDNSVACWGSNTYGQLGLGAFFSAEPRRVISVY